ncbi:hypothetical protein [Winogradskyella ursingii]|uniref:hypothetical protein n=1 Tax=Winogradskyella ursingii TaxID=2686079 RepID=UPI0015C8D144|nr:hypothetical protein [Winogradskyella ursingii]
MELVINQKLKNVSEPIEVFHSKHEGILHSHYKSVVNKNFNATDSKSVFGIRQRLKASQLSKIDHTAAILKLSVFALLLIVLF